MNSNKTFAPPSTTDPEAAAMEVEKKSGPTDYEPTTAEEQTESNRWLTKAREAYSFSTTYIDGAYRKKWEDSIKAFNSEHPSDSKYNSPAFDKRSKIYRPKTRAIIRKTEAAAASAYFSNSDVVSIQAENQSSVQDVAASEIMKELVQHHLSKSIPWFQVVMGGLQDAMTTSSAVAHIYWETKSKAEASGDQDDTLLPSSTNSVQTFQGSPEQAPSLSENFGLTGSKAKKSSTIVKDIPQIDLIPIENIRIDPAASWVDPVETSPYIIHLIPMYVGDVKSMMDSGTWIKYSEGTIKSAIQTKLDTTYQTRLKKQGNPYSSDSKTISDYEVVWVQRHIHREDDVDYDFYTLGDVALLTDPVPLSETVFHGKRPYVIGNCMIETHKVFPSTIPEISRGLQEEANEIANQRLDNVKFAMNKKWIVARNKQVDLQSLVRNVPGSITMADSPDDIREVSTPDVTASAYQEQDRINVDMDELLGNFGAGTVQNNKQLAQTASGMAMLNSSANVLVEYTLRTYTETFIQRVLEQLVLLIQNYETDETLLKVIGKRSAAFKKMGSPDKGRENSAENLIQRSVSVLVNVGMGATSPEQKITKLITGMTAYANIAKSGIPNLNIAEVGKEIFGALGYADGSRFVTVGDNPEVQQLQQQVQQLQKALQDKTLPLQVKKEIATQNNQAKMIIADNKERHTNARTLVDHFHTLTKAGLGSIAATGAAKTVSDAGSQPKQQPAAAPVPPGQK